MPDFISWIGLLSRCLVGLVLVVAAFHKWQDLRSFARALDSYGWLPTRARRLITVAVPAVESVLGVAILAGIYTAVVAPLAAALFVVLASAFRLTFGREGQAECGCFGTGGETSTRRVVVRGLSLAVMAGLAGVAGVVTGVTASVLLTVLLLGSAVAFASSLLPARQQGRTDRVTSEQRRRFLRLATGALMGLAAGAVFGLGKKAPVAEAACYGCGSCGTDYIFMYCTAPCCGAYLIKKWNYCETYCYQCSTSSQIYCGVSACC